MKRYSQRRVALAVSLIKKDNFEWVIQKGTELGVSEFIPLVSERSEKKSLDMVRAEKIMIEACEQSGRGDLATIREPQTLSEFLAGEKRGMIAFHTSDAAGINGADAPAGRDFSAEDISDTAEIVACIGPEGGWTESEVAAFREKGAAVVKLDAPILRAETAAIAVATLLLLL